MSVVAMKETVDPRPLAASLLPIMGVVFVGFLVIGVAMPVLPLYVHDGLGFGTFVVGLVAGSQFAASLIARPWAGHYSDGRGAKRAVVLGLLAASASGLLYLCSLLIRRDPEASVAVLLLGRAVLGGAESFIITAAVSWGLAIVDAQNTGKVIAWLGSAMFAAFAIGAPVGSALYAGYGFVAIALVTALVPLAPLLLIAPLPAVVLVPRARLSFVKVFGKVWVPGLGSALGSVGFGAVTTFAALLFADRGWTQGWLAYTAYAVAFILARVFFSHAADRFQVWRRQGRAVLRADRNCRTGADVAGRSSRTGADRGRSHGIRIFAGLSGFGVEAVRRVPAQSRGLAMGAYTAFLDLAQGLASPALGLVAKGAGLNAVFLVSAITVLCAALVASWLIAYPVTIGGQPQ
ncbi:MFS transporter [Bradyrhizobium retamae]|uniref:MFS transporter n=1 Tax=Bradyrhizobium retamae TaxID=1300035 RepID=UPI000A5860E1|nr:MFS transporter [Bradyrhizobium retamae]